MEGEGGKDLVKPAVILVDLLIIVGILDCVSKLLSEIITITLDISIDWSNISLISFKRMITKRCLANEEMLLNTCEIFIYANIYSNDTCL